MDIWPSDLHTEIVLTYAHCNLKASIAIVILCSNYVTTSMHYSAISCLYKDNFQTNNFDIFLFLLKT